LCLFVGWLFLFVVFWFLRVVCGCVLWVVLFLGFYFFGWGCSGFVVFWGFVVVMVFGGMSLFMVVFGPIREFWPIFIPGISMHPIPVFTLSPMIAPSFLLPVSILFPFIVIFIVFSSSLRFAVMVPAPKFTFCPIMLSPT